MFYPIHLRSYTFPATHISCLQPQFPWRVAIPKWLPSGCLQERLENIWKGRWTICLESNSCSILFLSLSFG